MHPYDPAAVSTYATTPLSALLLHGVGSSSDTWWRLREDLGDLGWETTALDLAGHGDRPVPARGLRNLSDLTEDVWAQVADQRFDVVVGHSLGAVVALDLAAAHPGLAGQVVVVDPPALGGALDVGQVADSLVRDAETARADPDGVARTVALANPRWSWRDAEGVAGNRARFDTAVAAWLRDEHWDLPALVVDCPVPVGLVVADGPETATVEPGRSQVLAGLEPSRVVAIRGGHGLHRDRPALFLRALLDLTVPTTAAGPPTRPSGVA
jgi:pimeloyl-ACP methyl ester carboxylesterase